MDFGMATHTFFQHYIEYLTSPGGAIAIFVVLSILLRLFAEARKHTPSAPESTILGCFRVGLRGKSNLEDQYEINPDTEDREPEGTKEPRVKALMVYPVKSCRGVELSACEVTGTGLRNDRLFSFAQLVSRKPDVQVNPDGISEPETGVAHQWRFITQREFPRLALVTTELWIPDPRLQPERHDSALDGRVKGNAVKSQLRHRGRSRGRNESASAELTRTSTSAAGEADDWTANGGCLVIRFPYEHDRTLLGGSNVETLTLRVPLSPTLERAKLKEYRYETMEIWKDCPSSINMSNEIDQESLAKLKYFLGVTNPLGLFREDDSNLRTITRSLPKDRDDDEFQVGFADAFPVHILNLKSARAVDDDLPENTKAKGELDAIRFRANIYTTGVLAYAEDEWMRIQVGAAVNANEKAVAAEYHAACRTARCILPNVDPSSGLKDRIEPHVTLKRTRQVDEGAKPHPCLGLSMIPLFARGVIRVGDKIEVLETGEHYYEKMFG